MAAEAGEHTDQVKAFIQAEAGDAAVETNLHAAETVLSYLPDASAGRAKTNGLILGRIQAGKTMAIISTIALAADNDYRVFVVLTSDNVWLHKQTYDRLSQALPGLYFRQADDLEFASPDDIRERGVVLVCTKNGENLRRLLVALEEADLSDCPALIIDDEADQASLDTKARDQSSPPSTINGLITQLRETFDLSAFLQVTATPNALLLQPYGHDYRPAFVVVLEPGSAYVGGSILFADDAPYVKDADLEELINFLSMKSGMPKGLKKALSSFLMAATLKHMFGAHRSFYFLCHVSHLRDRHELIGQGVDSFLGEVSAAVSTAAPDDPVVMDLRAAYDDICGSGKIDKPPAFEVMLKHLRRNIPSRDIQVLNSDSEAMEPRDNRIYNFLIGGNRLGRGVTIKRLLTTYYGRFVKKPQMDTMQQHARMYGYRRSELDVIRIFVPKDMAQQFRFLDESDTALRGLVKTGAYEGIEPIYANPNMRPTRSNVIAGDLGHYVAGHVYSPQFPTFQPEDVTDSTASLDAMLAKYNVGNDTHAPAEAINIDELVRILSQCRSHSGRGGQWQDSKIRAALDMIKDKFPEGWVIVRRGRNLTNPDGRLRDPSTPQDRPLRQAGGPCLWMYRQNGAGWAGVPFWIPRLQFPDGRYTVMFNIEE